MTLIELKELKKEFNMFFNNLFDNKMSSFVFGATDEGTCIATNLKYKQECPKPKNDTDEFFMYKRHPSHVLHHIEYGEQIPLILGLLNSLRGKDHFIYIKTTLIKGALTRLITRMRKEKKEDVEFKLITDGIVEKTGNPRIFLVARVDAELEEDVFEHKELVGYIFNMHQVSNIAYLLNGVVDHVEKGTGEIVEFDDFTPVKGDINLYSVSLDGRRVPVPIKDGFTTVSYNNYGKKMEGRDNQWWKVWCNKLGHIACDTAFVFENPVLKIVSYNMSSVRLYK